MGSEQITQPAYLIIQNMIFFFEMNSFLNLYTELVISKHYESKKNGHGHPVFLHLHKLLILKKNSKRQMFYFKVFILKDMHVESFT